MTFSKHLQKFCRASTALPAHLLDYDEIRGGHENGKSTKILMQTKENMQVRRLAAYVTKVYPLNAVAHLVQRRGPAHHAHNIGNNQQNATSNP